MKSITVFTPTYNRKHTLPRTYKSLCKQTLPDFEWLLVDDGSTDGTENLVKSWIEENRIPIRYIWKENGGLHTGYNTAYANIDTELCVCIDSDDYMPEDAIEKIIGRWSVLTNAEKEKYCGIEGLDFNVKDGAPIGGRFPEGVDSIFMWQLHHPGDSKSVMRTDLMKKVAPMPVFPGERNFNPSYLLMQVQEDLPMLLMNENLCWVEYQETDSMSAGIWRQYWNSPKSFAEFRRKEMSFRHCTFTNAFRLCIHYVSSCIICREKKWLSNSPRKFLTICASPFGVMLYLLIKYKNR